MVRFVILLTMFFSQAPLGGVSFRQDDAGASSTPTDLSGTRTADLVVAVDRDARIATLPGVAA